jgi:cytochrome c1
MRRRNRLALFAPVALSVALALAACESGGAPPRIVQGGSTSIGKNLIVKYGCGSCHTIPGIKGAEGLVGPPLIHWGRRSIIAGRLANTPDNLIRWIHDPQGVEPGTDMPNLGVTQTEARNIAAYLENIQ